MKHLDNLGLKEKGSTQVDLLIDQGWIDQADISKIARMIEANPAVYMQLNPVLKYSTGKAEQILDKLKQQTRKSSHQLATTLENEHEIESLLISTIHDYETRFSYEGFIDQGVQVEHTHENRSSETFESYLDDIDETKVMLNSYIEMIMLDYIDQTVIPEVTEKINSQLGNDYQILCGASSFYDDFDKYSKLDRIFLYGPKDSSIYDTGLYQGIDLKLYKYSSDIDTGPERAYPKELKAYVEDNIHLSELDGYQRKSIHKDLAKNTVKRGFAGTGKMKRDILAIPPTMMHAYVSTHLKNILSGVNVDPTTTMDMACTCYAEKLADAENSYLQVDLSQPVESLHTYLVDTLSHTLQDSFDADRYENKQIKQKRKRIRKSA